MTLFTGYGAHPVFCLIDVGVFPHAQRGWVVKLTTHLKIGYSCTSIPLIGLLGLGLKSSYAVIFRISKILCAGKF
jgi:hypothetical protein